MCVVGVLKETDISFIFFAKIIVFYISFTIRTYRKDDRCACFFTRSFASFYLRLLPVILAFCVFMLRYATSAKHSTYFNTTVVAVLDELKKCYPQS